MDALLRFEGLVNFRDIGGHQTQDGRTIRTGRLFRSGELSRLSRKDQAALRNLNLKLICDLRTPRESSLKQARIPLNGNPRIVNVPIRQNLDSGRLKVVGFLHGKTGAARFERFIKDYYRTLAFDHKRQLREVFNLLSDPNNLPALIHCNAGKDRTGFISALIQLLAGVPRQQVIADYLLTNQYYRPGFKKALPHFSWLHLFQIWPERLRLLVEAHADYLDDVLDEILKEYLTIDEYLSEGCGVDRDRLQSLKQLLLS